MHSETISFPWQQGGGLQMPIGDEISGSLIKNQTQAVATLAIRGRADGSTLEVRSDETSNAILTPSGGRGGIGVGAIQQAMAVRRLTPRECERLQGFPDDYTLIPMSKRNKKAEQNELSDFAARTQQDDIKWSADGPRYKALGNSMAVPVMAWIGQRIAIVDAIPDADKTP